MLGFLEERAARTVHGAVSDKWAKILMNRRNSRRVCTAHYILDDT